MIQTSLKAKNWIGWAIALGCFGAVLFMPLLLPGLDANYRALASVAVALLGCVSLYLTKFGQNIYKLFLRAKIEFYRVSWPSKDETLQAAMLVGIFVVICLILISILDAFFSIFFPFLLRLF